MGHFRNLDLSDHFLDIYHFYTKALLNDCNMEGFLCYLGGSLKKMKELYIRFSVKFQGLFAKTDCDVPIINAIILFFHF